MALVRGPLSKVLSRSTSVLNANLHLQQFGQSFDDHVWNGATACTHCVCQCLALIWNNQSLSLNRVNDLAEMPDNPYVWRNGRKQPRGMNNNELAKFFVNADLPYKIVWGYTFAELLTYLPRGPIFYGMRYGTAPEDQGTYYGGTKASAPFAEYAGKTQLTGFENGRHAVLMLGKRRHENETGTLNHYDIYRKEPNHGSGSRPEKPSYDIIRESYAKAEYDAYRTILGNTPYAAIPTRSLV